MSSLPQRPSYCFEVIKALTDACPFSSNYSTDCTVQSKAFSDQLESRVETLRQQRQWQGNEEQRENRANSDSTIYKAPAK